VCRNRYDFQAAVHSSPLNPKSEILRRALSFDAREQVGDESWTLEFAISHRISLVYSWDMTLEAISKIEKQFEVKDGAGS
jgi:hypothetical protein